MTTKMNRETWLGRAADLMRPAFVERGHPLPAKMFYATSWPTRSPRTVEGQCCHPGGDAAPHVTVSPRIREGRLALGVLAHELCHAALGPKAGHRAKFERLARSLGLAGERASSLGWGHQFHALIAARILDKLGPYPHEALALAATKKGDVCRLLKAQCGTCGYVVRVTRKWVGEVGAPHCPLHGEMEVDL